MPIIPRREHDKERKAEFYRKHKALFEQCDIPAGWTTPIGGKLVLLAKDHFDYSESTSRVDIWRSLMREYRRAWRPFPV